MTRMKVCRRDSSIRTSSFTSECSPVHTDGLLEDVKGHVGVAFDENVRECLLRCQRVAVGIFGGSYWAV